MIAFAARLLTASSKARFGLNNLSGKISEMKIGAGTDAVQRLHFILS